MSNKLANISDTMVQEMSMEELIKILVQHNNKDHVEIEQENIKLAQIQFIMIQRIIDITDTFEPIEKIWKIVMRFYQNLTSDQHKKLDDLVKKEKDDTLRLYTNTIEEFKKNGQKQTLEL